MYRSNTSLGYEIIDSNSKIFQTFLKVVYENSGKPVTIICPDHGEFQQVARYHAEGAGCRLCAKASMVVQKTKSQKDYLEKAVQTAFRTAKLFLRDLYTFCWQFY